MNSLKRQRVFSRDRNTLSSVYQMWYRPGDGRTCRRHCRRVCVFTTDAVPYWIMKDMHGIFRRLLGNVFLRYRAMCRPHGNRLPRPRLCPCEEVGKHHSWKIRTFLTWKVRTLVTWAPFLDVSVAQQLICREDLCVRQAQTHQRPTSSHVRMEHHSTYPCRLALDCYQDYR